MRFLALLSAIAIGSSVATFAQQALKANAVLVNLSQPVYPPLARQANIHGNVIVAVTVHPDGKTEVAFESGHSILCANGSHELPVFRTTETEIVDVIGYVTGSMRQFNQRSVQAFIDQKFHRAPERARARRVA
jgi:hypothetical protein